MAVQTKVDQLSTSAAISPLSLIPLPFPVFSPDTWSLPGPSTSPLAPTDLPGCSWYMDPLCLPEAVKTNAPRLHKSQQLFHRVTQGSEINTAASLTHVWYECRGTFTGADVFTGSLAPPPIKECICLSEDKEANTFSPIFFDQLIFDRMNGKI